MVVDVFTAAQALEAPATGVGTVGVVLAVVLMLLTVTAMFGILFWGKWLNAGDPTGVVERQRRERLGQNPAYG